MAYPTVTRFSDPERLVIELAEPGRPPVRHDIRLRGIGADGADRFIETEAGDTEAGEGSAPRRIRLDHIAAATRPDGSPVDLGALFTAARPRKRRPHRFGPSYVPPHRRAIRDGTIGLAVVLGMGSVAAVVGAVTGDHLLSVKVFGYGSLAIGVAVLLYVLHILFRAFADTFRPRPPSRRRRPRR